MFRSVFVADILYIWVFFKIYSLYSTECWLYHVFLMVLSFSVQLCKLNSVLGLVLQDSYYSVNSDAVKTFSLL